MRPPNTAVYKKYKERRIVKTESGDILPGVRGEFFKHKKGKRIESMGVFSYKGKKLYCAWGFIDEPHCRFNAVAKNDGSWHTTRNGCPIIIPQKRGKRTIGFTIKTKTAKKVFRLA